MGYMSEVGIKIKFADGAGREKIVAALGERWQVLLEVIEVDDTTIKFYTPFAKWYTGLFEDVSGLEQLVRIASERNALPHDDPEYVPSSGFFARIGEDLGDVEEILWDGDVEGLPCGFDLGSVEVSIRFSP
jgi:hypothetical protein